jgi:carboxypeptidase C (cathepsin A)
MELKSLSKLILLLSVLPGAFTSQLPLRPDVRLSGTVNFPLDSGNSLASEPSLGDASLSSLPATHYTSFGHPAYPAYNLRIKQTDGFCDPTVKSYSGYIDTDYGAKHLFFYFFESRSNPEEDDVLMWINGGQSLRSP